MNPISRTPRSVPSIWHGLRIRDGYLVHKSPSMADLLIGLPPQVEKRGVKLPFYVIFYSHEVTSHKSLLQAIVVGVNTIPSTKFSITFHLGVHNSTHFMKDLKCHHQTHFLLGTPV